MYYDNFKTACKNHGTSLTVVLKGIGRSTGLTGKWKDGSDPSLAIVCEMAEYMGISLDELVMGRITAESLPASDMEWLEIIHRIPKDKQQMCKDFLKTHMAVPEKYHQGKRA